MGQSGANGQRRVRNRSGIGRDTLGGTRRGHAERPYLEDALGPLSIEMQKRIKQASGPAQHPEPRQSISRLILQPGQRNTIQIRGDFLDICL